MIILKALDTNIDVKLTEINYARETNFNSSYYKKGLPDRDILRIFITGIYNNAEGMSDGVGGIIPKNNNSLFMYKHVFSKFVIPDESSPTRTLDFSYGGMLPDVTYEIVKPFSPDGLYPLPDKKRLMYPGEIEADFVRLKIAGGKLLIPSGLHKGLLLDGCHIMAMMKVRYYLKRDIKILGKLQTVKYSLTTSSKEKKLSPISAILLDILFRNGFGGTDLPQMNDKDNNSPERKIIRDFLDPDSLFKQKNGSIESFRESIKKFWEFKKRKFFDKEKNISEERLKKVLNEISAKLSEIINEFTLEIYRELGGLSDDVRVESIAVGDGSNTKGLLDNLNHGVKLFSYDHVVSEENVEVAAGKKYSYDLPEATGTNRIVHFDIFGIDRDDVFWIFVEAFRGETGVATYHFSRVKPEVGIRPFEPGVYGIGSAIWRDEDDKIIGFYSDETCDLVIVDKMIDKIEVAFAPSEKINTSNNQIKVIVDNGAAELLLTVCTYVEKSVQAFDLELDASNLFANDRFEVSTNSKKTLFWPRHDGPGRQNVQELIALIRTGAYTLKTELIGNGVGMMRVPPVYDASETYINGDYIMKNNIVGIFNGVEFIIPSIQDSTFYDYQDLIPIFIYDNTTKGIYRLRNTYTSPVGATIDPLYWELIGVIYKTNTSYSAGDRVISANEIYEAIDDINGSDNKNFDTRQWKKLPKIEVDPRYQPFSKNAINGSIDPGDEKDVPYKLEDTTPPGAGTLEDKLYALLRYSYVQVEINREDLTITFKIDSFASPLVSRLDKRLLGPNLDGVPDSDSDYQAATNGTRKSNLDVHTAFGRNGDNNSDLEISSINVPYYNHVLTALRCFGVLEAVVCRIKFLSNNDATVVTKLDELLESPDTFVNTANVYDGSGNATANYEKIWYDGNVTSMPPQKDQYAYYKWYTSATEQTSLYGTSCSD